MIAAQVNAPDAGEHPMEGCTLLRTRSFAPLAALLMLVLVLGVAGCASPASSEDARLVGTWTISMGGQATAGGPQWQFDKNGKLTESGGGGMMNVQNDYKLSNNVLTITTHANGKSAVATLPVQWVNSDQLKIGMGGSWLTLSRKK